jgi:hypothetical protein
VAGRRRLARGPLGTAWWWSGVVRRGNSVVIPGFFVAISGFFVVMCGPRSPGDSEGSGPELGSFLQKHGI